MYEISNRKQLPYSAICQVVCYWFDGSVTSGTGVIVGPNDVLTALHVVESQSRTSLRSLHVIPGADTTPSNRPYGVFVLDNDNVVNINRREAKWDLDGNGMVSSLESAIDMAVIGLTSNIQAVTGSLPTLASRTDFTGEVVGYPGRGTGMMAEEVSAFATLRTFIVDENLGPGSSGGPLLKSDSDGRTYVTGIASAGNDATNTSFYAAIHGPGNAEWLSSAIAGNDYLMGDAAGYVSGGYGEDVFVLSAMRAASGGISISDFGGRDKLIASPSSALAQTIDLTPGSAFSFGGARFSVAAGTIIEEVVTGRGADNVVANSASNRIVTNEGDDTLTGLGGSDSLFGGAGVDTAVYRGPRADYTITERTVLGLNGLRVGTGGFDVADRVGQRDGTDMLTEFERLKFSDAMVAIDIAGSAGKVAKLLGAVFGQAAVANKVFAGIGLSLLDGGMTYTDLAQAAVVARFGRMPGNVDLVSLLYTNVVGSTPSAAELEAYTALLDSHVMTQGNLATLAADSPANLASINITGLAANGLEYTVL